MTTRRFTLVDGLDTADPVSAVADPGTGLVFLPTALQNLGLNYFDGRFLRADDLNFERTAQRRYADVGRQPGGFGIGYGLMLKASDTRFTLGSGVAIDKDGRLISLDDQGAREFSELVSSGKTTGAAGVSPAPSGVYIVRIARSAQLAGNAEILGRVCDTCVSPQDKPTAVDGVRVWAEPMPPVDRPTLSNVTDPVLHARSQIASGFFAYEKDRLATPMSASSLSLPVWCGGETPSANSNASEGIAVGVVAWDGSSVSWYDDWTVRREYKESRPERYWAGLLEQRPWSLFMAQVLQFQCQLAEAPRPAATTDLLAAGFVEISPADRPASLRGTPGPDRARVRACPAHGPHLAVARPVEPLGSPGGGCSGAGRRARNLDRRTDEPRLRGRPGHRRNACPTSRSAGDPRRG